MSLYAAIDLHHNNCVPAVMNELGKIVFTKRVPNRPAGAIVQALLPYREELVAVAVESTPNWYWLERELREAHFKVALVNTTAVKQYSGKKHGNDFTDAANLADLMRMGRLPTAYICPEKERALRDLARKRSRLVVARTSQLLSEHNLLARDLGEHISGRTLKAIKASDIDAMDLRPEQKMALKATLAVVSCLDVQINVLEREVLSQVRQREDYKRLQTISGIGEVLGLTIALETGDIARFASAGNYASYCRMVDSKLISNGKKKGEANRRCGNRYLAWAFMEAAHFAVRYDPVIKQWHQRKASKVLAVVAIKAVAHKLARAAFHVMKSGSEFDARRAFS